MQRVAHRKVGIISDHIHAKPVGGVGHFRADRAKPDDTERLSLDFRAGKLLFGLLHGLGDAGIIMIFLYPLDTAGNVAGGQKQTGQHQLLHTVGVGARGVEHDDPASGAFIQRNIVDAGTRPGDGTETIRE